MALERLSLGPGPIDGGGDVRQLAGDAAAAGGDEGGKAARLPRWTRQEILVLIRGKRAAESRVRRGRASGSGQIEPKWASVSSYCRKNGVNRGPVQCRKRWSNLAGDYKKIKEWESRVREDTESFWVMRNDLRRERKLPGFFDREVYDILDGAVGGSDRGGGDDVEAGGGLELELAPAAPPEGEPEAVFDSGRSAAADDGMFSDFEQSGQEETARSPGRNMDPPVKDTPAPIPISVGERQFQTSTPESPIPGPSTEKQPEPEPEAGSTQEGKKRKRSEPDEEGQSETTNVQHQLIQALEKNGKLLSSHLESQNTHLRLDREQRNSQVNSLVTVLNKLVDALGRIADKL